jgi:GT2 family glycosyltransferase
VTAAPRVSVCIPTRDQARHLGEALAGVLAQDIDGLEVIVHDDASSDETAQVVAACADPGVRYRRHPSRIGVAANRTSCLAAARGEYVAWVDSDDVRAPGSLARQVAVLDAHPEVVLVHGGHGIIDETGRELPSWAPPFDADAIESSGVAFGHLVCANELTTSTVVVRRSAHAAAGPFAEDIGDSSSDWEMWLRLALLGAVAYTADRAASYRQHPQSISRATSAGGERLRCNVRVLERVLREQRARIPDPAGAAASARAALAAQALLHAGDAFTRGDRGEAVAAISLSERLVPGVRVDRLRNATLRGEAARCMQLTRSCLGRLAVRLEGTRFGAKVHALAVPDSDWDAQMARAAASVARCTPPSAVIAAIAKWDPAVVDACGREGCNYPDRTLLPDGYPVDGTAAVDHLRALRDARGVTHLVVPAVSRWWLEHYAELAAELGAPLWRDDDCAIFAVGASR